ncbi:2'-5' RNA ligase family protein [Tissierella sp. MB52-C2]|uniref:2'-5' RNA ligase family protein n=1 Tax=Tissierella sp. MB52-C2 TaxID=3070999 RepID=UPI00280ACC68|nr:2'-5' RNA ligase family protein [Tissierella sp. MB52-C2]WMM23945.1 2'-5' RNA ligase family protein [Tissierella sp. MB52-C2]
MVERCIMIFPEFNNMRIIDEMRDKYDPLVSHVSPHITLVFPFCSDISSERLKEHIEYVLSDISSFKVMLKDITPVQSFGNYLFLNIQVGKEEIYIIHKKLYTGILEPYLPKWLRSREYHPHMTVGKIESGEDYEAAILKVKDINDIFETIVDKVSVEIIDENEDSIIEMEIELK